MRRLVSSGTSMLALCGTLLFYAVALADPADDVKAVYAAWDAAFSARDAKRVAAFYTKDAVFVPQSHTIIKGEGDIESFVQGLFDISITEHKLEFIEVVASDAHTIAVLGKWSVRLRDGTGDDGIVAQVLQKGTSKNSRYRSAVTKLPANDSASLPFRFINVHCRVVRDWQRKQFFEVPKSNRMEV